MWTFKKQTLIRSGKIKTFDVFLDKHLRKEKHLMLSGLTSPLGPFLSFGSCYHCFRWAFSPLLSLHRINRHHGKLSQLPEIALRLGRVAQCSWQSSTEQVWGVCKTEQWGLLKGWWDGLVLSMQIGCAELSWKSDFKKKNWCPNSKLSGMPVLLWHWNGSICQQLLRWRGFLFPSPGKGK